MNRRYSIGGGGKPSCSKSSSDFNYRNFINFCRTFFEKTLAFTLAETLIVMGIIGVVAALTLPNLNSSTGDKEKVAKVKKIYQNLNDAFGRAEAVYGPIDEWCVNYSGSCRSRQFERILEFMKYSKKCDSVTACSIEFDKNGSTGIVCYPSAAILADGSAVVFSNHIGGDWRFRVDIDGVQKGANKQGYDVFYFPVNHEKGVYVEDIMSNSSKYVRAADDGKGIYFYDYDAAAWIINFDNMDYLKTSDGTTCPNGTKLTVGGKHSCK